jgi:hypothetical protein
MVGYTQTELDGAQAKWSLRFPPDLIAILRERRGVIENEASFDWIKSPDSVIRDSLDWPLESFWFDVQHNNAWWPDWGEKPTKPKQQYEKLGTIFAEAPKLIPVFGHRYIPEEPIEAGNPVFSVYQMDVIIYGANLEDYIYRETESHANRTARPWPPIKPIRFWTRAVEYNGAAP